MNKRHQKLVMCRDIWQTWEAANFQALEKELSVIDVGQEPLLVRLQLQLDLIRNVLEELHGEVISVGFEGIAEEVMFMKHLRPKYLALHIYYSERLLTESHVPKTPGRQLLIYYQESVQFLDRCFHFNYGFYQYYKLRTSEQDQLYFLRDSRSEATRHLLPVDGSSGTAVSDLFGRFAAYERLRSEIISRISAMGCLYVLEGWQAPFTGRRMKWTGNLINLVELVYGLFYTRQLNDGQASMRDITRLMEDVFQVELKQIFRRFAEIRRRKRLAPAHLCDQMREQILNLIDKDLAHKPKKQHGVDSA